MKVAITSEQLRYRVSGGISTYLVGLKRGLDQLDSSEVHSEFVSSKLRPFLLSRLWARGIGRVGSNADLLHASSLRIPPKKSPLMTVMVHDLLWKSVPHAFPSRAREWHDAMLERARENADHIVVPSLSTAQALFSAGFAQEKVTVIEEGADHLPAADLEATDDLLKEKGIEGDFVLSVGTIEPRKNLKKVINAYQLASGSFVKPATLLVVGPKGWGEAVPTGKDVVFTYTVSPTVLAGLYQRARAFVYAPLAEGFGLPPLEAMWSGVPTVVSDVPSVESQGFHVDPHDVNSIAFGLIRVMNDEAERHRLIAEAKTFVQTKTWLETARRHVELWTSL